MLYIELFLIAISLSIDSFSLALSVGLNSFTYNKKVIYSIIVGLFHFIMPILGFFLRTYIDKVTIIPSKQIFIIVIIFIIVGIFLNKESNKEIINPFIFAFSVSIDSFSIGITLKKSILLVSIILFSLTSGVFTYTGFKIAKKVKNRFNHKSKIISIIILLFLLIYNILK